MYSSDVSSIIIPKNANRIFDLTPETYVGTVKLTNDPHILSEEYI